eukprot:gnl/Ergobibamus_cyprinoides/5762.p2 GENE.gnl/Ergobibamus_cyprinoides/5762~~gnl/Ergobibamus_cyprinoides/5762.p2  ORF type:complete len:131 (+),score=17.85 gnl/Ergobibamus_cyprinoides/5762:34-393(+)
MPLRHLAQAEDCALQVAAVSFCDQLSATIAHPHAHTLNPANDIEASGLQFLSSRDPSLAINPANDPSGFLLQLKSAIAQASADVVVDKRFRAASASGHSTTPSSPPALHSDRCLFPRFL